MAVEFELDEVGRQNRTERVKRMFGLTDEQVYMTLDRVDVDAVGDKARVLITLVVDVSTDEALAAVRGEPIEKGAGDPVS